MLDCNGLRLFSWREHVTGISATATVDATEEVKERGNVSLNDRDRVG